MMDQAWKYLSVYFSSMVKFMLGPSIGYFSGLSITSTIIFTVLGMMTSVVIFAYLGRIIKQTFFKNRKSKLFTKKNRKIITVWNKYGLAGIAFLTPLILSPILGTALATSFGERPKKIMIYMLGSAIFWGLTFSILFFKVGELDLFK